MQDRARKLSDSKGFTITELIIVIALIGIMMAIAAPSIISQITHLRLTRSVRDVVSELNAARFKAIAQNRRYQVEFTVNAGATPPDSYQLQFWNDAIADFADEPGRAAGVLEPGISITSPGGPTFTTVFNPNGSATNTSICIDNTQKANDRMRITVRPATGMIEVSTGC